MLLDGEVVALDGGRPSFGALADRMHVRDRRKAERLSAVRPVTLMVFDLLRLYGSDLTAQPLSRAARAARAARPRRPALAGAPGLRGRPRALRRDPRAGTRGRREQAPLGSLPARAGAPATGSSRRTASTISAVVGGWRPGEDQRLRSAGRRAAGRARRRRRAGGSPDGWAAGSPAGRRCSSPRPSPRTPGPTRPSATRCPGSTAVGATWVDPVVVVEARTLEVTRDGRLRQPAYLGLRADLTPDDLQEVDGA